MCFDTVVYVGGEHIQLRYSPLVLRMYMYTKVDNAIRTSCEL